MRIRIRTPRDGKHARWMRRQIVAQRSYAHSQHLIAWWLELLRSDVARQVAHKRRHDARLALMTAAKMQRGLNSGAYLRGRRQYPYVEDQCGCARYCNPGRDR